MKVWVCIRDYGYEGMKEPVRVFASKALADIYVSGASEAGFATVKIFEREIETGEELKP